MRTPRRPPPRPSADPVAEALQSIEARLAGARPGQRARLLRRAGDACASGGQQHAALRWYGQAIDQFLELEDADSAAVLCRMILYVQPEAVRARCTLSWLALTSGRFADAAERIRDYVAAAEAAGQEELAAQQLGWMFDAAGPAPELRAELVRHLFALGVHGRAHAAAEAPAPDESRHELWSRVLEGALAEDGGG